MNMIHRIESIGVRLVPDGDKLKIIGNVKALTAEQMEWLKQHKPQILAELRAANEAGISQRLRRLARLYRIDGDELLDWFHHDLEDMEKMDASTLEQAVRDYAANRENYRSNTYAAPVMWFYKINRGDPDYIRQVLLTDDPQEAEHRLTEICGHPVYGLHSGRNQHRDEQPTEE